MPIDRMATLSRTDDAGRGAGRPSFAVEMRETRAGSAPARATTAAAKSNHVVGPWLVTWNVPGSRATASWATTAVGHVAHAERVHPEGAIAIGFAPVDIGPGRGVDDDVGLPPGDRTDNGVTVADIECRAGTDDVATGNVEKSHELAADLSLGAGDEDPRHFVHASSTTGARSSSGSHHARLAAYQS